MPSGAGLAGKRCSLPQPPNQGSFLRYWLIPKYPGYKLGWPARKAAGASTVSCVRKDSCWGSRHGLQRVDNVRGWQRNRKGSEVPPALPASPVHLAVTPGGRVSENERRNLVFSVGTCLGCFLLPVTDILTCQGLEADRRLFCSHHQEARAGSRCAKLALGSTSTSQSWIPLSVYPAPLPHPAPPFSPPSTPSLPTQQRPLPQHLPSPQHPLPSAPPSPQHPLPQHLPSLQHPLPPAPPSPNPAPPSPPAPPPTPSTPLSRCLASPHPAPLVPLVTSHCITVTRTLGFRSVFQTGSSTTHHCHFHQGAKPSLWGSLTLVRGQGEAEQDCSYWVRPVCSAGGRCCTQGTFAHIWGKFWLSPLWKATCFRWAEPGGAVEGLSNAQDSPHNKNDWGQNVRSTDTAKPWFTPVVTRCPELSTWWP